MAPFLGHVKLTMLLHMSGQRFFNLAAQLFVLTGLIGNLLVLFDRNAAVVYCAHNLISLSGV